MSAPAVPASHRYALIMAGGRGTRFWPRSRRAGAKQVLRLFGDRSLIQQTVDRLSLAVPPERIWIITSEPLRDEIVRQLPEVPPDQVLAEPAPRNTAPCIALFAHLLQGFDPEAVMGVFPADHVIARPEYFLPLVDRAFEEAGLGNLVVFGVRPRWAETGYGYVEFPPDARFPAPVLRFHEKPDRQTAERFVAAGNFAWNSGMFFWRAAVYLEELRRHLPRSATVLAALPPFRDPGFTEALTEAFPLCDSISVDYAILEKAERVTGFAADDIGWNDVGSWNAVYELEDRDQDGNAFRSDVLALDSRANYVDVPGKVTALIGLEDLVVVETPDALLIARRSDAQKVGDIVKLLEKKGRGDLL